MLTNKKSQAWYIDFGVSLMVFVLTIVFYYGYTNNYEGIQELKTKEMLSEARSISSSLMQQGYPYGWDNNAVIRIGILDEGKLNSTKLSYFNKINYSLSKTILGTKHDYFIFFEDSNADAISINGLCGIGSSKVKTSYNIKTAYYNSDLSDSGLKEYIQSVSNADLFYGDDGQNVYDIQGLVSNLSKYKTIILESPNVDSLFFPTFKSSIENYSSSGGVLVISGQLIDSNDESLLGADFGKKAGQLAIDRTATVQNPQAYMSFLQNEQIIFDSAYYVQNQSIAENFIEISNFDSDEYNAVSKWNYYNGTVYFFSDFKSQKNLSKHALESAFSDFTGKCNTINLSEVSYSNLVKNERYLNHESSLIKMKLYVWE